MGGGRAYRIEAIADRTAAALFAGATAYALFRWSDGVLRGPQIGLLSAGGAAVAFLLCARGLRSIAVDERFPLPSFDLPPIERPTEPVVGQVDEFRIIESHSPDELLLTDADRLESQALGELLLTDADRVSQDELLLTDADRLRAEAPSTSDELVLDDILAELKPDSRVVRLFDPAAMPTPGQLNARIERHLGAGNSPATAVDQSQALFDALAELRRSLR